MELIDKAKLYNTIAELEDKATDNFLKESQASQHKLVYMGELRGITTIKHLVADFPTVESPKGEWEDDQYVWICNQCHKWIEVTQGDADMNFCPHCGADMRKKVAE